MTSVWTYSRHTPIHCHSGGTLGHDLCSASSSSLACVSLRARVCAREALYGGVLLTLLTVSFHMEINEEAPFNTLPHLQWDEQRVQGVQRIYHKKKLFRVTILWSCPHPPTRLSKNKHIIFLSAVCTRRNPFSWTVSQRNWIKKDNFIYSYTNKKVYNKPSKLTTITGVIKTIIQSSTYYTIS